MTFYIEYRTTWGEDLRLCGSIAEMGNDDPAHALPMRTTDGIHWTATVDTGEATRLTYRYLVFNNGNMVREEWAKEPRTVRIEPGREMTTVDSWREQPDEWRDYYNSAFTEVVFAHPQRTPFNVPATGSCLIIKACEAQADSHHVLCVCGSGRALGDWDPDRALPMSDADFPTWQIALNANDISFPLEYKFVLRNRHTGKTMWEFAPNRCIPCPPTGDNAITIVGDHFPLFDLHSWRGAGVAIPVFSLRSEGSFGIGDFGDLRRFITWAARTGQRAVQVLPINDTTMHHNRRDSYPYNAISIYALHPMYIDLRQLPALKDAEAAHKLEERRRTLNDLPEVDYEGVDQAKWHYLRMVYEQVGERTLRTAAAQHFVRKERAWLLPYAVYSYLRDRYHEPNFRLWPDHQTYSAEEAEAICAGEARHDIGLYLYIQYQLHRQLTAASRHARSHGIILKGDIPIGISRNSVEAWTEPYYFNFNGQTGAPPDDFATNGQNWGFPTYEWDVMRRDGYAWWTKRFRKMAEYFDAYRIDHILGFFRIWEIPIHSVHGLLGHFVPSLPMTREEIEGYGLAFHADRFLLPYIDDTAIADAFGPLADRARADYLLPRTDGTYALQPTVQTQRQVEALFAGHDDPDSTRLRDGLYALISDVLFIEDTRTHDCYHPRISAHLSRTFQALPEHERKAFSRLYDDYYYRRHDDFWETKAMEKLPRLIGATRMLVCGEDLGMLADCVRSVMNKLHILSLEVERMPKTCWFDNSDPGHYPYLSVSTISTHDMSTLRGWWTEDPARTQTYYNNALYHRGTAPAKATPEICRQALLRNLSGHSMLCILSWQDWLSVDGKLRRANADDERINVPANPRQYWRYRMHLTIEQLMHCTELNKQIREIIYSSGRL